MPGFKYYLILFLIFLCACNKLEIWNTQHKGELEIIPLSKNAFIHVSYLPYSNGLVACNGLVYLNKGEAIVFDTPINPISTRALYNWITKYKKAEIKAVIPGHFHVDCLGGLEFFHEKGIASYANEKTVALAKAKGSTIPQNAFRDRMELTIGEEKIICEFRGEGHTVDNIISYIPKEKIMFGGCLIKSDGASKGNLNDANVDAWSNTALNIKAAYPELKIVVPGHGQAGGIELLDYTAQLFSKK